MTADEERRFRSKVQMGLFCWEWMGGIGSTGYGQFRIGKSSSRKMVSVHRISWELYFGPIPDGLSVLHKCDNRKCLNPAHLFLGTHTDNMRDMNAKGRRSRGESHRNAKLTVDQVREIRRRISAGESQRVIAVDLGVSQSNVSRIVSGRMWATVSFDASKSEAEGGST